jgi:Domain of unknown function (DUF4157)
LDSETRASLEPKFGHSFGDVRVFADGEADRLAQEYDARAFTVGQDVFFRDGEYDPGSPDGLNLLAHELTHTIQQRGTKRDGKPLEVSRDDDPGEREAHTASSRVMSGQSTPVVGTSELSIQRWSLGSRPNEKSESGPYGWLNYDWSPSKAFTQEGSWRDAIPKLGGGFSLYHDTQGSGQSDLGFLDIGVGNLGGTRGENERFGAMANIGLGQGGPKGANQLGPLGMDGGVLHAGGGLSIGDDGLTGQAQASVIDGALSFGNVGQDRTNQAETQVRAGLGLGLGGAGRLNWGDKDKDGRREIGIGGDAGIFSGDFKTEWRPWDLWK